MSHDYFSDLNYSMANEDTGFEYALVRKSRPESVLSVCGSGGRALPLLGAGARRLVCLDLAPQQLWLASLREQLYRALSREDYLRFFGYPPFEGSAHCDERRRVFDGLTLADDARQYFRMLFERRQWTSLLYAGKWERTFIKIAGIVQRVLGPSHKHVFECADLAAQRAYYEKDFSKARWTATLGIVGNAAFFNALLYKGHFVKKNIPESHFQFYWKAYERLLTTVPARENYFLQLSFLGKVAFAEGVPVECAAWSYDAIRSGVEAASIEYLKDNLLEHCADPARRDRYDFISMSDVPSYFSGEAERDYLQRARSCLRKGGLIVVRPYLRVPENSDLRGFEEVTADYAAEVAAEKTQMYRTKVYRKIS